MNSPGRDPREHCPKLDDKTAEFLIKAIERDRDKRFHDAAEFREALQKLPRR
jgi:hypothetical protein